MTAQRRHFSLKQSRWLWRLLLALAVSALLVRSVVAPGFMPVKDPTTGEFSMAFCTAQGEVVQLRFTDIELDSVSSDADEHLFCPFGMLAHQDLLLETQPTIVLLVNFAPHRLAPLPESRPALPALGPPLGARAPPPTSFKS